MNGFGVGRGSHNHICPICGEPKEPLEESCNRDHCEDQIEYGSPTECLQQVLECVDLAIEESTFAEGSDESNQIKDPQFVVLAAYLHAAMKLMFLAAKESKEIERNAL